MAKTRVAPDPNVGANLAQLMATIPDLGTQQRIATKAGLGQTTVGRILRGEVSPNSGNLRKVADAFNVDVGYLHYKPEHFRERMLAGGLRKLQAEPRASAVAHDVSYTALHTLPITPWEVVVSLEKLPVIPADLMVEVPDDALAARGLSKGQRVWFKAASKAEPRNVVLIEANGRRYIRRYAEDAQGPFAQALDDAYPSFREFNVVAVMFMRPDSSI